MLTIVIKKNVQQQHVLIILVLVRDGIEIKFKTYSVETMYK